MTRSDHFGAWLLSATANAGNKGATRVHLCGDPARHQSMSASIEISVNALGKICKSP